MARVKGCLATFLNIILYITLTLSFLDLQWLFGHKEAFSAVVIKLLLRTCHSKYR